MDVTNRVIKLCRRISDIEYALECDDQGRWVAEDLRYELERLSNELEKLQPANYSEDSQNKSLTKRILADTLTTN
jgi:hypothetical protein